MRFESIRPATHIIIIMRADFKFDMYTPVYPADTSQINKEESMHASTFEFSRRSANTRSRPHRTGCDVYAFQW